MQEKSQGAATEWETISSSSGVGRFKRARRNSGGGKAEVKAVFGEWLQFGSAGKGEYIPSRGNEEDGGTSISSKLF